MLIRLVWLTVEPPPGLVEELGECVGGELRSLDKSSDNLLIGHPRGGESGQRSGISWPTEIGQIQILNRGSCCSCHFGEMEEPREWLDSVTNRPHVASLPRRVKFCKRRKPGYRSCEGYELRGDQSTGSVDLGTEDQPVQNQQLKKRTKNEHQKE